MGIAWAPHFRGPPRVSPSPIPSSSTNEVVPLEKGGCGASALTGASVVRPTSLKRGEGRLVRSLRVIVEFGQARVKVMVTGSTGCRIQTPLPPKSAL